MSLHETQANFERQEKLRSDVEEESQRGTVPSHGGCLLGLCYLLWVGGVGWGGVGWGRVGWGGVGWGGVGWGGVGLGWVGWGGVGWGGVGWGGVGWGGVGWVGWARVWVGVGVVGGWVWVGVGVVGGGVWRVRQSGDLFLEGNGRRKQSTHLDDKGLDILQRLSCIYASVCIYASPRSWACACVGFPLSVYGCLCGCGCVHVVTV